MGCNCGGSAAPAAKYQLTTTTGETRVYLSETEAQAALSAAGGGTIQRVT
jgi:hypothetical protein